MTNLAVLLEELRHQLQLLWQGAVLHLLRAWHAREAAELEGSELCARFCERLTAFKAALHRLLRRRRLARWAHAVRRGRPEGELVRAAAEALQDHPACGAAGLEGGAGLAGLAARTIRDFDPASGSAVGLASAIEAASQCVGLPRSGQVAGAAQELSCDPLVFTVDDVLTGPECEHLIALARPLLRPSVVDDGRRSSLRTGEQASLEYVSDATLRTIALRVLLLLRGRSPEVVRRRLTCLHFGCFIVAKYGKGERYLWHHDAFDLQRPEGRLNRRRQGQRLCTALLYLNDVEDGGDTRFSKLELAVQPRRSRLLAWSNVHDGTLERHDLSEHAGMPVKAGEKWVLVLLLRDRIY